MKYESLDGGPRAETYRKCLHNEIKYFYFILRCGPGSVVGSDWLRAGRSGDQIPVEARFSAPVQTGPGAHPSSCTMGTGSLTGIKSGRGVTLMPRHF